MNLGATVYAGVLPDPKGKPPETDRRQALLYREWRDRDVPAYRSNNPLLLASQYKGTVYACLTRTWNWLCGSTFVVEQHRESMRKSLGLSRRVLKANLGGAGEDEEYHPVEYDHPLRKLLRRPNRRDGTRLLWAKMTIQVGTTGGWHLWTPKNGEGRPALLYSLPSALMQPLSGGVSLQYPFGGWRLMPSYAGGMWSSVGIPAASNVPLDAREVFHFREPHPWLDQVGYGAVEAMAQEIDTHNGVNTSRAANMAKGVNPSAIVTAKGATQDQVDEVIGRMNRAYAGADNHGKLMGLGDTEEINVTLLGTTPRDMDYPAGFEQMARALICGLGLPPIVLNMFDDGNYAQYWAAVQAWCDGVLEPRMGLLAEQMSLYFEEFYGDDVRVRIKLPKINDRAAEEEKFQFDVQEGLLTYNQAQALRDREQAGPEGDVPASVYLAQQSAAVGLGPDGQPLQGGDPNAADADMSSHPLNAVGDSILEALGVQGGDGASHPGNDPFPGDDADDDGNDDDSDTDLDPSSGTSPRRGPGIRHGRDGRFAPGGVGKAFGRYEESKHKRDHGRYASKPGANGKPQPGRPGAAPSPLPPAAARHPKVVAALRHLATGAAALAAGMQERGVTPESLLGNQSTWETWFCTQYADATAHALGVDSVTAAHVLTHLIAHGVDAVKRHLGGKPDAGTPSRPGVARPPQTADTGAVSRPDNPGGAGSLPNRVKAFAPIPELDAFLETLV